MNHLPLFEPHAITTTGNTRYYDQPFMLFKRAILLDTPGDSLTVTLRGRQFGIVFFRHTWSGTVAISYAGQTHTVDLFAPDAINWVFEGLLAPDQDTTLTLSLLPDKNPQSHATQVWIQSVYVSDYLTSEVPERIYQLVTDVPFTAATLNQLTDVFKWYDHDWRAGMQALNCTPDYTPPDFVHRKSWEWAHCIFGLDQLGCFHPEARALGVGVGWEPLSFFFSNYFREVIATDLYPVHDQWSEGGAREGNPRILENPDDFAPFPYQREQLRFVRMDGKQLDFPDASFDIVWSCSSIEHFGGHTGAAQSMREIERVLKPGGVVAMITEYVLPDPETGQMTSFHPEYFNLRCVYEYLIRPVPQLQLVQKLDLALPDYYVRRACRLPDEEGAPHTGSSKPHIVLFSPGGAYHTSIALFFRKVGGQVAPAPRRFLPVSSEEVS